MLIIAFVTQSESSSSGLGAGWYRPSGRFQQSIKLYMSTCFHMIGGKGNWSDGMLNMAERMADSTASGSLWQVRDEGWDRAIPV